MIKLALTGSIGMGKSTIAKLFADQGVPILDADKIVHDLYEHDEDLKEIFSQYDKSLIKDNGVDKIALSRFMQISENRIKIEYYVHKKVQEKRDEWYKKHLQSPITLYEIPLLFEKKLQKDYDYTIVVYASKKTQKQRVMQRVGMTEEKFLFLHSLQIDSAQKCQLADFVINTDQSLEDCQEDVVRIIEKVIVQG
jgi:dephospho-CoA kinase